MKTIALVGLTLFPQLLFAGTDCQVKEFADHFLATCVGDAKGAAGQLPSAQPAAPAAQHAAPAALAEPQKKGEKAAVPAPPPPPRSGDQASGSSGHQEQESALPDPSTPKPAVSQRTRDKQRVERMKEIKRQTIIDNLQ